MSRRRALTRACRVGSFGHWRRRRCLDPAPVAETSPVALLRAYPAWPPAPGPGWTPPQLDEPLEIPLVESSLAALTARGFTIRAGKGLGEGNRILLDARTPKQRLVLDLSRAKGCTILLGRHARLAGEVSAGGRGHLLAATGWDSPSVAMVHCTMRGERALITLGHGLTSNRTNMLAEGPEGAVLVGDDAMFATGITLRTSDSHAIIDLGSRRQVNVPRPVVIGPHVWIGQEALVMKGVTVGAGSIVAGRAVVTRPVPPRALAAGVPARIIRENVSWSRLGRPRPEQIDAMIAALPEG